MDTLTKYKNKFISLYGEDFLLSKLFPYKKDGFFVEIGCIDGLRFSNTFYFESIGWKGLCIEAHSDYINKIKNNRPNSLVEHSVVGEKDLENVEFFANSRGTFSTVDEKRGKEWESNIYFNGFDIQKLPMKTLNTIFKKYKIKDIDILSLDIEGYEVEALMGLDFNIYRPTVLVVESDSNKHKERINNIVLKYDYSYITSLRNNIFYSQNPEHKEIICNKVFKDINIIHTKHPLDDNEDCHKVVDVITRR